VLQLQAPQLRLLELLPALVLLPLGLLHLALLLVLVLDLLRKHWRTRLSPRKVLKE
jgi:hypothetical protein